MRTALTLLYRVSGALAAAFLVAICAVVAAQVFGNIIDRLLILTAGTPYGFIIPAYSDFAGFFLAASTFFALAHTLMRGEHVRVRLVLNHLPAPARRWAELWCAGFGAVGAAVATYFAARLTMASWQFGDTVTGMVALPLWIPQFAMVAGLVILTIALIDVFCSVLTVGRAPYERETESASTSTEGVRFPPSDY